MLTSLWAEPPITPTPKDKAKPNLYRNRSPHPNADPKPRPQTQTLPLPRAALQVECSLKLGTLLAVTEPTFYDLYLRVDNEQLYPVPVRLANLRVNGRRVNENSASITSQQNDQLVRRFFTVHAA